MKNAIRISRTFLVGAAALASLAAATPAVAQPERDPIAAEALFKAGRELLEKGDWPASCAKFEASQKLDPSVSAMVKIAKCREYDGKLATAWYELEGALKLNREKSDQSEKRRAELEAFTNLQIAAIESRLPHLRVVVKDAPPGFVLTRDGQEQQAASLGESLPIDPGSHELVGQAPGYIPDHQSITAVEGQMLEVTFHLTPSAVPPPAVAGALITLPNDARSNDPGPSASATGGGGGQRTAGFVLGGVGAAAIATGAVLQVIALTDAGRAANGVSGNATRAGARGLQTGAWIAAGAGAAALGSGVVLVLTAPKPKAVALGLGPGSVSMFGTW